MAFLDNETTEANNAFLLFQGQENAAASGELKAYPAPSCQNYNISGADPTVVSGFHSPRHLVTVY